MQSRIKRTNNMIFSAIRDRVLEDYDIKNCFLFIFCDWKHLRKIRIKWPDIFMFSAIGDRIEENAKYYTRQYDRIWWHVTSSVYEENQSHDGDLSGQS